jgi:hypothetical protein
MNRILATGLAAVLAIAVPLTASAAPAGFQRTTNQIDSTALASSLIGAALRLPAGATENAYLQVFLAEITTAGASQLVVNSAIDSAIGVASLPRSALQALEALRKRSRQPDYTAALGDRGGVFGAPAFTSGGGSDYTR